MADVGASAVAKVGREILQARWEFHPDDRSRGRMNTVISLKTTT